MSDTQLLFVVHIRRLVCAAREPWLAAFFLSPKLQCASPSLCWIFSSNRMLCNIIKPAGKVLIQAKNPQMLNLVGGGSFLHVSRWKFQKCLSSKGSFPWILNRACWSLQCYLVQLEISPQTSSSKDWKKIWPQNKQLARQNTLSSYKGINYKTHLPWVSSLDQHKFTPQKNCPSCGGRTCPETGQVLAVDAQWMGWVRVILAEISRGILDWLKMLGKGKPYMMV